jgi:hypothetical protein
MSTPEGIIEDNAERETGEREHGEERFRIYRLRDNNLYLVATTDQDGIGTAIVTLGREGEFDGCRVGIYDSKLRTWVLNPWEG